MTSNPSRPEPAAPKPDDAWLGEHAGMLYRYAVMKVKDDDLAQDLVQDTLVAAWRGRERFRGDAADRTWLVAILKNKIADHFRRAAREVRVEEAPEAAEEWSEEDWWRPDGHWETPPGDWGGQDRSLERAEFWRAFEDCLEGLSDSMRAAFLMREVQGEESADICKNLGISASNLWVLLHRARVRLRECLEHTWFEAGAQS